MPSGIWTVDPRSLDRGLVRETPQRDHGGAHGSATTFGRTLSGGRASVHRGADSRWTDDPSATVRCDPQFLDAEDFPELLPAPS